jgi:hypothetical protein
LDLLVEEKELLAAGAPIEEEKELLAAGAPIEEEKELLAAGAPIEEEKVLLGSEILDEVERMVLSSVVLPGSWCSLDLFFWVEPDWAGGHRLPMFESSWSLPMHQSTVTKNKISQVRYEKRNFG